MSTVDLPEEFIPGISEYAQLLRSQRLGKMRAYFALKEEARMHGTPGTGFRQFSREWTTHNNEAGKDRTRDAVSVTVRPMPLRAKVRV